MEKNQNFRLRLKLITRTKGTKCLSLKETYMDGGDLNMKQKKVTSFYILLYGHMLEVCLYNILSALVYIWTNCIILRNIRVSSNLIGYDLMFLQLH